MNKVKKKKQMARTFYNDSNAPLEIKQETEQDILSNVFERDQENIYDNQVEFY